MSICLFLCIFQTLFHPKPVPVTDSLHCIEGTCRPALEQLVTSIERLYDTPKGSTEHRFGENLSQKEHALQTAELAFYQAATQRHMIVAALLHDIGQLLVDECDPSYRIFDQVGSAFLAKIWGPRVAIPILHSIEAKRFLVSTDPGYVGRLSEAKQNSLSAQGGALLQGSSEYASFVKSADVLDALALRRWDDQAILVGKKTKQFSDFHSILVDEALYYLATLYPKYSPEELAVWIEEADEYVLNALSYDE